VREAVKDLRAAVFFDRDGVLNIDHGYVGELSRFEWVTGARQAIAAVNRAGRLAIVITNQSGVARGMFTEADVAGLHAAMQADLATIGARIDAFYICPYHADARIPAFRHPDHPDRKPNPGMVLRAIADWDIDPGRSMLIGDKESDMEAAHRAGVSGLLFEGGDLAEFLAAAMETK
jgi:D-glycero-D-manno-heptose 1,7-bisphosphate phosphatase